MEKVDPIYSIMRSQNLIKGNNFYFSERNKQDNLDFCEVLKKLLNDLKNSKKSEAFSLPIKIFYLSNSHFKPYRFPKLQEEIRFVYEQFSKI